MNKSVSSKEEILSAGKEIIREFGMQGLNIRGVAQKCGISVGAVYNYFPSKSELVIATIESVWIEIMQDYRGCKTTDSFEANILALFNSIEKGSNKYSSFFSIHSMSGSSIDHNEGRKAMDKCFLHIKKGLLDVLDADSKVREDAFSEVFKKEDFIDFVFSNLLSLLMKNATSCDFLLIVVRRMIYPMTTN